MPLICSDKRINKTFAGGRIKRCGTCRENGQCYRHFDQCDWKRLPCATRCSIANVILMNTVLNSIPAHIITLQQLAELSNNFHNFYLTVNSSVAGTFFADSKCLTVCILLKMDENKHVNNSVVNCYVIIYPWQPSGYCEQGTSFTTEELWFDFLRDRNISRFSKVPRLALETT